MSKQLLSGLASVAGLAIASSAVAAPEVPTAPGPGGAELLSFAGSLLVVVGSILAFGWLYARFRPGMNQGADQIRIVATRPLGPKERLLVVELGEQQILVGVSQGHMQTLHTLAEPLAEEAQAPSTAAGFATRLRQVLKESAQ